MKRMKWVYKIPLIIILGTAALALFTYITQWLWNWLVPELFNGPAVTFWQGLGLLVLSKILFSGLGGKGGNGRKHSGRHWKRKWTAMSPEERERFKSRMQEKWCHWEKKDEGKNLSPSENG